MNDEPGNRRTSQHPSKTFRVAGMVYIGLVATAGIFLVYKQAKFGVTPGKGIFLLASVLLAGIAVLLPKVLGRSQGWTTVIAALVLQFDVASAMQVNSGTWFELVPSQESSCNFPPSALAKSGVNPTTVPAPTEAFTTLQYNTAVDEIRTRVEDEQQLFLLKIGITIALLASLLLLWNKGASDEGRTLDRKTRVAQAIRNWGLGYTFFWATVLINAIIDARLRFNSKMMETLGCWIHLVELSTGKLYWETYLRADGVFFKPATYALLRVFPNNLLTILLFASTMYTTVISNPVPKPLARWCAGITLLLFAATAISYHAELGLWNWHCAIWVAVGSIGLLRGSRTAAMFLGPPTQETTVHGSPQPPPVDELL